MTAINVNLDEKFNFSLTRNVTIGKKTYNLTFNDEMYKKTADLQIAEVSLLDELNKQRKDFEENMNVDQRKKFMHEAFNKALNNLFDSLDSILGKGEGKRLYDFYGKSTYVLGAVANELVKLNDQLNSDQKNNLKNKKKAIKNYYAKKKRK